MRFEARHGRRLRVQVARPSVHQPPTLLEQITTRVGRFRPVLESVCKRRLSNFARDVRPLLCPYAEARPRAEVSFQLADKKHIIPIGPKPFPTNLPTWTDWRSVGESELTRGRERRRAQGRGKCSFRPWNRRSAGEASAHSGSFAGIAVIPCRPRSGPPRPERTETGRGHQPDLGHPRCVGCENQAPKGVENRNSATHPRSAESPVVTTACSPRGV